MVTFTSNYWAPALESKMGRKPNENDNQNSPKLIKDKSTFAPPVVSNVFSSSLTEQDTESDSSGTREAVFTPPQPIPPKRQSSYKKYFKNSGNSPSEHDFLGGVKASMKDMLGKGSKAGSVSSKNGGKKTSEQSFSQKYGFCEKKTIGRGATAVVRIAHKTETNNHETLYAIKEFRKKRKEETEKEYVKKLTSEFCISSTLKHQNIVDTVDLIKDESGNWCEVMEYCAGGDLYTVIKNGNMGMFEINCCFKQLINGVKYLHSMGVAHRDLKPENLLINDRGQLKITDFGVSDVFRMVWETKTHLSKGICGSEPYIAPELFVKKEYDAIRVDIWATGVVYYTMVHRGIPFRTATMNEPNYLKYLEQRETQTYPPFDKYNEDCRTLMYKIMDPDITKRASIEDIENSEWFKSIEVCSDCVSKSGFHSHFTVDYTSKN